MYQRGIINVLVIIIGLVFVAILIGVFSPKTIPNEQIIEINSGIYSN